MFKDKFKEGASALGGGLKGMLGKLLIGGVLAAFCCIYEQSILGKDENPSSRYNRTKISWSLQQCTETNLGCRTISNLCRLFEDIGVLFEDIGLAITDFKNGDILGGISKLIGGLATFFMNTIDNLITSVFNLFAGLFGFEGTESIGGEISRFLLKHGTVLLV